jgi:hypothetical protein
MLFLLNPREGSSSLSLESIMIANSTEAFVDLSIDEEDALPWDQVGV